MVSGSTVPDPGEVWVIEHISAMHDAVAAARLIARVYNNGCYEVLFDESVESMVRRTWTGRLTLPPGGNLWAGAVAPGDGKKVYLRAWGYKMKVAE